MALRPAGQRPLLGVPSGPVPVEDRRTAWRAALPGPPGQDAALTARHPLDPALTAAVGEDVRSLSRLSGTGAGPREATETIRCRAGAELPDGVRLSSPAAGWDRLVLPGEPAAQLRDAVARLEHSALVLDEWGLRERARAGHGVRLLLTGAPGTGKSLAAEVIATAAGTDLMAVDVSQVVSKWLGETEKNLAAIFDAAERVQAVLLLDEADALFAARTAISGAHDRWANLETAYLLQRMDRFDGMAVLTSNLRANIDPAFLRRMDFVVEFPLPDEARRRELWRLHLPARPIADDSALDLLASVYPVPGAWIRNAAVAAAFLAAQDGATIRPAHLIKALAREYAKAGRPFPGVPAGIAGDREEQS
ncbi:ATP-binding protein [Nonomuraea zeae]